MDIRTEEDKLHYSHEEAKTNNLYCNDCGTWIRKGEDIVVVFKRHLKKKNELLWVNCGCNDDIWHQAMHEEALRASAEK